MRELILSLPIVKQSITAVKIYVLLTLQGLYDGSGYDENLNHSKRYSINALYKPTVDGLTYSMTYEDKDLIWTRYPKNLKELIISRRFSK